MSVSYIPAGHHTVTPYLVLEDVAGFLEFSEKAFDAEVTERIAMPDGTVMHAEIQIGDSRIMIGTASDEYSAMPALLHLYLPDADAAFKKAVDAGATVVQEPSDQFYGDRSGGVRDAFGNMWWVATHIEDVPRDEMQRRAVEAKQ